MNDVDLRTTYKGVVLHEASERIQGDMHDAKEWVEFYSAVAKLPEVLHTIRADRYVDWAPLAKRLKMQIETSYSKGDEIIEMAEELGVLIYGWELRHKPPQCPNPADIRKAWIDEVKNGCDKQENA